jgi:Ca2+:H+ antiporter
VKYLNFLLAFVPVGIAAELLQASPIVIFGAAALGIIQLAGILGKATEELAHQAGPQVGGLLNATFGNAAELIITTIAIREGLLEVVKASITGSILGNSLLVLGLAVLLGGLKHGVQRFSRQAASTSATMMTLAIIGLVIPAVFGHSIELQSPISLEYLSLAVAATLIVGYGLSLLFSFTSPVRPELGSGVPGDPSAPLGVNSVEGARPRWSRRKAMFVLFASAVAVVVLSEILVGAIRPVIESVGLTQLFLGVIVIPIIGNAAEHLVAVQAALKNKMDLAMSVALGSSLQIALFVAPLLVFISLAAGKPMNLIFNPFELAALAATVIIASLISLDGESNWLEGAQLLIVYLIVAVAFFFLPA